MTVFVLRMLRRDPEFLEWRIKMREKERTQKRVVSWGTPVFEALLLVPGLDQRFGWSAVPAFAVIAADVAVLAGRHAGTLQRGEI